MQLTDDPDRSWIPACGGTETPFRARSGQVLLYMWNRVTGEHAYYDVHGDMFLSNEEAAAPIGLQ
jgi:hypothetical protein